MKRLIYLVLILLFVIANAQENLTYQKPPQDILDLVDVQRAPSVLIDDNKEYMVLLYRDTYKTIAELSEEELRLGGLRINPKTNIGSRTNYYNDIKIKNIKKNNASIKPVKDLPKNPRFANFTWSPDQKKIALTNTTLLGVELWVLDLQNAVLTKLTEANVNANMGNVANWFEDSRALLVKFISKERKDLYDNNKVIPTGPTVHSVKVKKHKTRPIRIF